MSSNERDGHLGSSRWRTAGLIAAGGAVLGLVCAMAAPWVFEQVGLPKLIRPSWLERAKQSGDAPTPKPDLSPTIVRETSNRSASPDDGVSEVASNERRPPPTGDAGEPPAEASSDEPEATGERASGRSRQRTFTVDGPQVDARVDHLEDLLAHGRFAPHTVDGERRGFRFVEVVDGGLYDRLGIEEGDIVVSVNGRTLTTQAKLLEDTRELKGERTYTLELMRDGRRRVHRYVIDPPFPETNQPRRDSLSGADERPTGD